MYKSDPAKCCNVFSLSDWETRSRYLLFYYKCGHYLLKPRHKLKVEIAFGPKKKSPTFDVGGRPYSIENIPRGFAGAQSVPAFLWSIWCLKMTLELDHSHYRCYVLYSLHLPKVYNNSFRYFVSTMQTPALIIAWI